MSIRKTILDVKKDFPSHTIGIIDQNGKDLIDRKTGLTATVKVFDSENYGCFEVYSLDEDETYYAEGGLWFNDDKELTDCDGVFSLPSEVIDILRENKFIVHKDFED